MKSKQLFMIALLAGLLSGQVALAESEPNNDIASANPLALGGSESGTTSHPGGDHPDYFKITLPSDGKVRIDFNITNGQLCAVQLLFSNGLVAWGSNESGTDSIVRDGLAAGDYYVKFQSYWTNSSCTYTVEYTYLDEAPLANDLEPNNSSAETQALPVNTAASGHLGYLNNGNWDGQDWWEITTWEDGDLSIELTSTFGQTLVGTLFDSDATTQLYGGGISTTSTAVMNVKGLAPGTYYLKIAPFWSTAFTPYSLDCGFITPKQANDPEPNDTFTQATILPLNSTVEGHNGYLNSGIRDYEDWYTLTTMQDGMLKLSLTPHASNFMYLYLFASDGTTQLASLGSQLPFTLTKDGLAAGTYYLRMITLNSFPYTGYNPYSLSSSFEAYTYDQDVIANDLAYMATTLPSNDFSYGHVGFTGNLSTDNVDWFKINYTGTGSLTINTDAEPQLATDAYSYYYNVKVYKDTLAAPVFNASYLDWASINLSSLSTGYYWISISLLNGLHYISYSINPVFSESDAAAIELVAAVPGTDCTNGLVSFQCSGSQPPYTVQYYRFNEPYNAALTIYDQEIHSAEGLQPGRYYATVLGDGASPSAMGTSASKDVVPVPENVMLNGISASAAKLTWDPLPVCINGYLVRYRETGSVEWKTKKVPALTPSVNLTGLNPGTAYQYQVAAGVYDESETQSARSTFIKGSFTTNLLRQANPGLNENMVAKNHQALTIFPNPATTVCYVTHEFGEEMVHVQITDPSGRIRREQPAMNAGALATDGINLTGLPAGQYLLLITGSDQVVHTGRLLVVK